MCYFSPRKQALKRLEFISSDGVPLNVDNFKHNCPHFEKEDNMNETEAFITQLCGTKFQLLQACLRGKSNTFWNDTASEK